MGHNRLPKGSHYEPNRDVGDVILFHERLVDLQETLMTLANSIAHVEPDLPAREQRALANEYLELADFTGYLASAARKTNVEVTETVAVMRQPPPISKNLRQHLKHGMDKLLIQEIETQPQDDDKSNFAGQVEAFCNAIRDSYKGRDIM